MSAPHPSPLLRDSAQSLADTAPLVRSALIRVHGRAVLITAADGTPVTSGQLKVIEGMDGPIMPTLILEFTLRGIAFALEIPLGRVFPLVSSWNGRHFVFALPEEPKFTIEPVHW